MNFSHLFKPTQFILGLAFCLFITNVYANEYISVQLLQEQGLVELNIKSLGFYQGDCIEFQVKNTTSGELNIWVEAGRRLTSEDENTQDILITKEIKTTLTAMEKRTIRVLGFCCQSSNKAPKQDDIFKIGFMAPAEWLQLTDFMKDKEFDTNDIQMAVWVISDLHNPASICNTDDPKIIALKKKVAEIRKIEVPWYCVHYESDVELLFSHRHHFFTGKFEFKIRHYCTVTIQIRTQSGRLMKTLSQDATYSEGEYVYQMNQNIKGWEKGNYEILVLEDNSNLISKIKFSL